MGLKAGLGGGGRGEAEEATGGGQGRLLLLWAPAFAELSIALGNVGACNFKKVK